MLSKLESFKLNLSGGLWGHLDSVKGGIANSPSGYSQNTIDRRAPEIVARGNAPPCPDDLRPFELLDGIRNLTEVLEHGVTIDRHVAHLRDDATGGFLHEVLRVGTYLGFILQ